MNAEFLKSKYDLRDNPFPPAASGIDYGKDIHFPDNLLQKLNQDYEVLSQTQGVKAMVIKGEYGSGKTVFLSEYVKEFFQKKNLKTFFFENPGVKLYDIVNNMISQLGAYEFSKSLWELCKIKQDSALWSQLIPLSYEQWYEALRKDKLKVSNERTRLSNALIDFGIANKEHEIIAIKLADLIIEAPERRYFEYRDFVTGRRDSLIPEKKEERYLSSLVKAVMRIYSANGVVFLIDEFEELAFKSSPRGRVKEYLASIRSLIDVSLMENLWIVLAMTPDSYDFTEKLEPALWSRFTNNGQYSIELEPLEEEDMKKITIWWLNRYRNENSPHIDTLFPFSEDILTFLIALEPKYRLPRQIIRMLAFVVSEALREQIEPLIDVSFVKQVFEKMNNIRITN